MLMNANESISYDELKNWLPKGYVSLISKVTGYSGGYISQVLKGERRNKIIWHEAIMLAEENRKKIKSKTRKINNFIRRLKQK